MFAHYLMSYVQKLALLQIQRRLMTRVAMQKKLLQNVSAERKLDGEHNAGTKGY
jgi:hypothetical protein